MKNFLLSKTIWGVILIAAGKLFPKLGLTSENTGAVVDNVFMVIGSILTVIGRFAAKKQLTIGPVPR